MYVTLQFKIGFIILLYLYIIFMMTFCQHYPINIRQVFLLLNQQFHLLTKTQYSQLCY